MYLDFKIMSFLFSFYAGIKLSVDLYSSNSLEISTEISVIYFRNRPKTVGEVIWTNFRDYSLADL